MYPAGAIFDFIQSDETIACVGIRPPPRSSVIVNVADGIDSGFYAGQGRIIGSVAVYNLTDCIVIGGVERPKEYSNVNNRAILRQDHEIAGLDLYRGHLHIYCMVAPPGLHIHDAELSSGRFLEEDRPAKYFFDSTSGISSYVAYLKVVEGRGKLSCSAEISRDPNKNAQKTEGQATFLDYHSIAPPISERSLRRAIDRVNEVRSTGKQ